jgi:hypothetical protein
LVEQVNAMAAKEELERLRLCVRRRSTSSRLRSRPFARRCPGAADGATAGLMPKHSIELINHGDAPEGAVRRLRGLKKLLEELL